MKSSPHVPGAFLRHSLTIATALALGASGSALATPNKNFLSAVSLHPSERIVRPLLASKQMRIRMGLKLRNSEQLKTFIQQLTAPGSQLKPLTPEEFNERFAPTEEQVQAVVAFMQQSGFTNIEVSPNRTLVSGDSPAGTAMAAFHTSVAEVTTADNFTGYANTSPVAIPEELQGSVIAVMGFQNVHHPHLSKLHMVPVTEAGGLGTNAVTGHLPLEFSSIYGGSGQTTGAGVTVGIITQGKITQTITDLNKFTSTNGLATVTTQTVNTGGTSNDASGVGEWNLDSQDIVGMAGGQVGKIIFYNIPSLSNSDLTADINTVVSANAAKIINVSLGECETYTQQDGSAAAQDQAFQQAVAQGQTFSISTGDSGADECGDGGTTPSWPAASQYVVAASGTTLNASTTTWNSATVWSDSGGSQSKFEPKPSWQNGLFSGNYRGVADIAYDADPNSGAKVYVNGSLQQIGGTSLSAPLFAGAWARVIAAKGTDVGFAAPLLYALPASDFHDITSGSNGISATVGYDLATGRGEPIISALIADIAGGSNPGNNPPTANFTYSTSDLTATFSDSSSDSDGSIVSHSWNFGDGATSTATSPSHTYSASGTYTVVETVTDNDGASNSKSASVTVTGGTTGGNELQNGVAVSGLGASKGNKLNYTMVVPAGATNLSFAISGGSGDADLYVKFGSAPTTSSYDCRPYINGNSETCNIANVQAGTYYVMLNAYSTFSGVSLVGNYDAPSSNTPPTAGFSFSASNLSVSFTDTSSDSDGIIATRSWNFGDGATSTATNPSHTYASAGTYTVTLTVTDNGGMTASTSHSVTVTGGSNGDTLQNGVPITGLSAARHQFTDVYTLTVPAGASSVSFSISGGSGDADLYVKRGSAPTTSSYDCRPYKSGNSETCTFNSPTPGTYYVTVRAYQAFSGVTLVGSY